MRPGVFVRDQMRTLLCGLLFAAGAARAAGPGLTELRGVVLDAQTGRPLQGALVSVSGSRLSAVATSFSGGFFIAAPDPACSLQVRLAGYSPITVAGHAPSDSLLEIPLVPVLYSMDEVVVQASRLRREVSHPTAGVNIIDRWDIEHAPATSLAGVLGSAPGLFVKDYGGGAGLKTISQRGLAAEHTAILLNGLPVNSAQHGTLDLGLITLENFERVEVLHGGASLSFGSQAVGGVVNLVSRPPASEPSVRAGIALGSYGFQRYAVSGGTNLDGGGLRLSFVQEGSEDDYRFVYHNGPDVRDLRRSNSDYLMRSVTFRGAMAAGSSTTLDAFATASISDRGVPGVVVSPSSAGVARQEDTDVLLQVGARHAPGTDDVLEVRAQGRSTSQRYADPSLVIGGVALENSYRTREARVEPRYERQALSWLRVAAGGAAALSTTSGDITGGEADRTDWGVYLQGRAAFDPGLAGIGEAYLTGGIRYDRSGAVDATSPAVGAGLRSRGMTAGPLSALTFSLRGALSRNFRAPTFNELYYNGGGGRGNSELRPEYGSGAEAGATIAFTLGAEHTFDASVFASSVDDRIVWSPAGTGIVMPRNLRRVDTDGFELSYALDLVGRTVRMRVHYGNATSVNASAAYPGDPLHGKSLIYVPRETGGASCTFVHRPSAGPFSSLGGTIRYAVTGPRYMTEDNLESLPPYDVLDAAVSAGLPIGEVTIIARCEITNLLNEDYQVIRGYPMPLRTVRVGLSVEY
jgi:outer membrane receptor for ferrienterochelin and colicins